MIVATREPSEYGPTVGVRRYMRTKLRMDPTTRVEKTKSSSLRPKLGREAMSAITQAVTPTSSSMSTLKGNCGSAATRAAHPARKSPRMPPRRPPSYLRVAGREGEKQGRRRRI
jgi:hypothetical protein